MPESRDAAPTPDTAAALAAKPSEDTLLLLVKGLRLLNPAKAAAPPFRAPRLLHSRVKTEAIITIAKNPPTEPAMTGIPCCENQDFVIVPNCALQVDDPRL